MNKAMPTAPSAPLMEDQQLVGHHGPPPPSYEQAMGHQPGFAPPPVQPGMPPYPPQNYMPQGPPMMMPQPQPQYPPVPPQQQAVVPPTQAATVVVAGPLPVGPKPAKVRCPICHSDIKTSTVTENQAGAHIACILMCVLGCCLCSCIPYCMDSCKNVRHTCPNCNSYLGTYKA